MSHDLLAELAGYRNELAGAKARGSARADDIAAEVKRVTAAVAERAADLTAEAKTHQDAGRDVAAVAALSEARRLREALRPAPARKTGGK
ncbi:hypothetical protein [Kitasatospora sp. NPDC057500]|uniref:hypothetical protein n=1 Tax=Kitasatospora sp. NPDC057500 TaxID=3346151 RepID=UPI00369D342B